MRQKAAAKVADRLLHGAAQPVADARPRVKRILVVAFDQAAGCALGGGGQPRRMQEPVKEGKVGKKAVGEDALQVEFQIGQLDQPRAIAQQAQHTAIGDDAVEFVLQVEEFLHHGVGGHAGGRKGGRKGGREEGRKGVEMLVLTPPLPHSLTPPLPPSPRFSIQPRRFPAADDVDRHRPAVGDAMGDGVALAVEFDAARLILQVVAEQTEQRQHPLLACLGCRRGVSLERVEPPLKNAPVILRVRPRPRDLILDLDRAVESKIGRALARRLLYPVQQVRREDSAFDADGGIVHEGCCRGARFTSTTRSANCACVSSRAMRSRATCCDGARAS